LTTKPTQKRSAKAKPKAPEAPTPRRDVRQRIAEDAERVYDEKIGAFFEEALSAEKSAWATCKHCQHKIQVDVPDWSARTRALETLLNQGFGRVGQDAEERNVTIIVERPCRHCSLGKIPQRHS